MRLEFETRTLQIVHSGQGDIEDLSALSFLRSTIEREREPPSPSKGGARLVLETLKCYNAVDQSHS